MAIKRYHSSADNTISNAHIDGSTSLTATGSNMGRADVSEVFSIYGRVSTSSAEISRVLTKFDIEKMIEDRNAGLLPASGEVSFYLRMFNAETTKTVPEDFKLVIEPVTKQWEEGYGLDLENYRDKGSSNWINATPTVEWDTEGGDYDNSLSYEKTFSTGLEDLELNISSLVEEWIDGSRENYGIGLRLTSSQEAYSSDNLDGTTLSFYTKRFFARGTEFFYKKPVIEARWNSSRKDDRGNFYLSSALAPAEDNLNTLYLYNYVRGRLANIPSVGEGEIYVDLYETAGGSPLTQSVNTPATGGFVSTGIYSCSVSLEGNYSSLVDVWHSGGVEFHAGTIKPKTFASQTASPNGKKLIKLTNLQHVYSDDEKPRFNFYIRDRNWSPTIYTVASAVAENTIIQSASYRIYRELDGLEVIPHGTGSDKQTLLSYDVSGNYFDFDMSLLEPGYSYTIKLALYNDERKSWDEQADKFTFRVIQNEY